MLSLLCCVLGSITSPSNPGRWLTGGPLLPVYQSLVFAVVIPCLVIADSAQPPALKTVYWRSCRGSAAQLGSGSPIRMGETSYGQITGAQ
jgi:hypothetical protein